MSPKVDKERLLHVSLERVAIHIWYLVVRVAEEVEASADAYVVVELDDATARVLVDLVHDELEEAGREHVALGAQSLAQLVDVNAAAAVRVHEEKALVLLVEIHVQVVEFVERDLVVAIGVVANKEQVDRLDVELTALREAKSLLQLDGRDRAVLVEIHFVEDLPQILLAIPRDVPQRQIGHYYGAALHELVVVHYAGRCRCRRHIAEIGRFGDSRLPQRLAHLWRHFGKWHRRRRDWRSSVGYRGSCMLAEYRLPDACRWTQALQLNVRQCDDFFRCLRIAAYLVTHFCCCR